MSRWLAAALALTVLGARAETVTLRFRWPAGLDAQVGFSGWRERVVDERRERRDIRGQYRMSTRDVADGLLVDVSEMRVDEPGNEDREAARLMQDVVDRLSSVAPDTVVDANGALVRIIGADETAATLRRTIDGAMREAPEQVRERLSATLDALLSAQRIEATVRGNWGRDIGVWAGLIIEPGKRYEGEVSVPVPMLPGARAPATVRYQMVGSRPCPAPAQARACATLEMHTSVSDADATAVIDRLGATLSARAGRPVRIDALTLDNRVTLVAEPATLLPHVIEYEQGTAISLASEGAPARRIEQREQRMTEYRYR